MRRGNPSDDEALDDSSLDEYGVWVKAGPDEPIAEAGETVSDLIDTAGESDDFPAPPGEKASLPSISDFGLDNPSQEDLDDDATILKGQEVSQMSEQDNGKSTSPTGLPADETEITLDDTDELSIDASSDTDDLSDMLLNIDDSGTEETIYLEDDDLSFDLEEGGGEELMLEPDSNEPQPSDDFSDDIVIPGLDEGELTMDLGSADSMDDLTLESDTSEITASDSEELFPDPVAKSGAAPDVVASSADIEVHNLDETGLDEFIDEQLQTPLMDDGSIENSDTEELTLEEESLGNLGFDLSEEGEEIVLEEGLPDLAEDSLSLNDDPVSDALQQDIDLDEDLEMSMTDQPAEEKEFSDPSSGSELEFDDVGAFENELSETNSASEEPARHAKHDIGSEHDETKKTVDSPIENTGASQILRSIEDELHAIRSELTDLRSELRKLRGRGDQTSTEPEVDLGESDPTSPIENVSDDVAESTDAENAASQGKGFFDDDEDETIALTGDELDNILNSADFTEEAGTSDSLDDDMDITSPLASEAAPEMTELTLDDDGTEETAMPELMTSGPTAYEDSASNEYPPIEEISLQEIGAGEAPDPVEAASAMASITETSEEDPFVGSEKEIESMAQLDIEQELAGIEDLKDEEDDIELYTGNDLDAIELDLPEEFSSEEELNDAVESSTLPDGEIEGLAVEEESEDGAPVAESDSSNEDDLRPMADEMSFNLKQEIKAVLAYMDKLLESLPEDKIEEFARSEHFDVYKKLFEELGL